MKSIFRLAMLLAVLPIFLSATSQEPSRIWAAISVSDPLFQQGWTNSLMIHFTLVNDGARTIDPKEGTWKLIINGREVEDARFIFGNGPRDARWKALPPGDSLRFG
jgi:hypothetical protein